MATILYYYDQKLIFLLYNSLFSLPKSLITFDYVRLVLVKSHNNKQSA